MSTDVFTPSLARQGLDLLLAHYPHLDVVEIDWQERDRDEARRKSTELFGHPGASIHNVAPGPWVRVWLGQPSQGEIQAWARWEFAILKSTGNVYRVANGAVEDNPYITVTPP